MVERCKWPCDECSKPNGNRPARKTERAQRGMPDGKCAGKVNQRQKQKQDSPPNAPVVSGVVRV